MYVGELNVESKYLKALSKSSIFKDKENFPYIWFVFEKLLLSLLKQNLFHTVILFA